jgi:hypothetical protein
MVGLFVNDEWKRIRKEAIVVYFTVLFQHLPRETDENRKTLSQNSQFPVQDSNLGRPKGEAGVLHFGVILNPFHYTNRII